MMPSLDHCMNKPAEMTALSNSLEVFDTYKHREDKDSDEESFHLPLDDDESDTKYQNGNGNETEEDILNKYDSTTAAQDVIDAQLEERLLNDEEAERKGTKVEDNFENSDQDSAQVVPEIDSTSDTCQKDQTIEEEEVDVREMIEENIDEEQIDEKEEVGKEKVEKDEAEEHEDKKNKEASNVIDESSQNKSMNDDHSEVEDQKSEEDQVLIEEKDVPAPNLNINLSNNVENDGAKDSCDLSVQSEISEKEKDCKLKETESKSNEEVPMETNDLEETVTDDLNVEANKSNKQEEQDEKNANKCENSNDSSKHQNDDSEDLFDISVIRDAQEDNDENAYNDHHSDENNVEESEEYEDTNIDKGEDESSDKANNLEEDEEEVDTDKQDQLKTDDVDIEESSLKLDCDGVKDLTSDTDSDGIVKTHAAEPTTEDIVDNSSSSVTESTPECSATNEVTEPLKVGDDCSEKDSSVKPEKGDVVEMDTENEDSERRKFLKRQLSEEDEEGRLAKKTRTEETEQDTVINEIEKEPEKQPLKTLLTLSDFMKAKKHNRRLTMHDLEEFCLQKICEVLVHKSELGDVQQQLKMQEQLIETMRKEIQQLTKQARDLEIVNKKLMNDLKQQTTTQKPLNPLKITRSVGLQVKFTPLFDSNMKRRPQNIVISSPKVNVPGNSTTPTGRGNRSIPNNTVQGLTKQVQGSPQKQQQPQTTPKPNGPLLSQALQNRRSVSNDGANKTNTQTTPRTPTQRSGGPSASVIDLTDEDDKKDKNKNSATKVTTQKNNAVAVRTPNRINTAAGIRLTTSQGGKVTPISSVVTSNTQQVMYVVQSSSPNALTSTLGPKAVVVNFQSANGVLSSSLNGSAVSVIPKQTNTVQLKTVQPSKALPSNKPVKLPNKHPAPLPPPPLIRVSLDKPLKPIPPKPHLTIRKTDTGIILQWKMPYELDMYEVIASYQLYAYQETSAQPSTDMWRKVGDVKALALPMACTLTQFADKNKYYFAVRPVDIHKRIGVFSEPEEISL